MLSGCSCQYLKGSYIEIERSLSINSVKDICSSKSEHAEPPTGKQTPAHSAELQRKWI